MDYTKGLQKAVTTIYMSTIFITSVDADSVRDALQQAGIQCAVVPVLEEVGSAPATVAAHILRLARDERGSVEVEVEEDGIYDTLLVGEDHKLYVDDFRKDFTVSDFVRHMADEQGCDLADLAIDAEQEYRDLCLETDGRAWRQTQMVQHGLAKYCTIELLDKPAFRQGMSEWLDARVKNNEIVEISIPNRMADRNTVINPGEAFFPVEVVKAAVQAFDPRTCRYPKSLADNLHWLL
jgi:hypothetical protein